MNDRPDDGDSTDEDEVRQDLERYCRLIEKSRGTWLDFWLLGIGSLCGGVAVYVFSQETWAAFVAIVLFMFLLSRAVVRISRIDGEVSYLHRKWIRRGYFFMTDGKKGEAMPHKPRKA